MVTCIVCGNPTKKYARKYCSNQCQADHRYKLYIERWRAGSESGVRGVHARALSRYLTRYLLEKYNFRCARCGWNEVNPTLGRPPLEIEHIDGDSENNNEENLILLCPNCHSLTSSYRNLNKGHGRQWRREKYVKIVDMPL